MIQRVPKMAHNWAPDAFESTLTIEINTPEPAKSWSRKHEPAEG
jgi:hypothetical protein